jgi:hypothetical protein
MSRPLSLASQAPPVPIRFMSEEILSSFQQDVKHAHEQY